MNVLPSALSSAGNVDSNSAPRSSTDKNADSGFDAMLNSKPTTQKPAASKPASNDPAQAKETRADDSATEASTEQTSTTNSNAGDNDKPEAAGTDTDAPWPPFGLSAIVVPAPEPAAQLPAALAAATQQAAPAAPATGATPALPGAAAAVAGAAPMTALSSDDVTAELTLPMTAANDDAGELNVDVDTPAPAAFASLLHNQALQEVRSTAPASSLTAPTPTPDLNAGDFDEAIGARVGWLAEQKIGHAHIRINPENMGQIDVKLQLDGDRVHASFSSAHADVRHALESSLPRLREMLGEQGLQLSHTDVGQQSSSQQQNDQGEAGSGLATGSAHDSPDLPIASSQNLRLRGLLDAYA
ncbi:MULTISPECIES: flagellar hook-length control protein FliK [Stenotrophomonas]|uniref:flagellar hook-length control protein FliK n=1 Tax=Stenotrophomonas TaxID=40323 RepID=UPI0007705635|nr:MULTISPECIES: flagellar hook-length control protein FliK [Stenotrophomonas]AMJ56709.1 hypothetical protein AXG53_08710 [Stenotrophomonas sp. KCTC 12332]